MAGLTYTVEAWVLSKKPPANTFQTLTVYSVEHGATLALQRLSQKTTTASALDLFDEASLLVEEPGTGQAVFVKEARILTRHPSLGKSYETLQMASSFATLVARNPVSSESRAGLYDLLKNAFAAFANFPRPDIVYLKSLYRFCRDEGYPLKQAWAPALPPADRTALAQILNLPMSEQTADLPSVERLQLRLHNYLRAETEIQLD